MKNILGLFFGLGGEQKGETDDRYDFKKKLYIVISVRTATINITMHCMQAVHRNFQAACAAVCPNLQCKILYIGFFSRIFVRHLTYVTVYPLFRKNLTFPSTTASG